jgi:hypothetical protein
MEFPPNEFDAPNLTGPEVAWGLWPRRESRERLSVIPFHEDATGSQCCSRDGVAEDDTIFVNDFKATAVGRISQRPNMPLYHLRLQPGEHERADHLGGT